MTVHRMRRWQAVLPLAAVILAALFGCAPGETETTPQAAGEPIRIGISLPLTGRYEVEGRLLREGYDLALEMLNAKGGVKGRPLQLIMYDDQSDAATVTKLYRKLIYEDRVEFLLGSYASPLTNPVVPIVEEAQVPFITTTVADPGVWRGKGLKWTVMFNRSFEDYLDPAHGLVQRMKIKSVAYFYTGAIPTVVENSPAQRDKFQREGINVLIFERYDPATIDFNVLASKAKAAGAEALVLMGAFREAAAMAKALSATSYKPKMAWLGWTINTEDFRNSAGDLAECIMGNAHWLPTTRSKGFIASNEEFVSRFRAKYGKDPDYRAAIAFGNIELLAQAINASLEERGRIDKTFVRDYLFKTKTETVFGPYEVIPEGPDAGIQVAKSGYGVQWQRDRQTRALRLEVLWPERDATVKEPCSMP